MEIVCTIGPATFTPSMVRMLWCAGVTIFRLNLSHTQDLKEIDEFVKIIKIETKGIMCIDTHGMKFRSSSKNAPAFTGFDLRAMERASKLSMPQVAVSFAQDAESVEKAREISKAQFIIAKLESKRGVENQTEIIASADAILIDRGDMARTIPIEEIPLICRNIIKTCKGMKTPVWIATNLLESMLTSPIPTAGEVNDIATLLMLGVDGLVLAAETAIGKYPIQCVEFIRKMIEIYQLDKENN